MLINFKTYSTEIYFDKELDPPLEMVIVLDKYKYYRVRVLALKFYSGEPFPQYLIKLENKDLFDFFEGEKVWVRHEIISII